MEYDMTEYMYMETRKHEHIMTEIVCNPNPVGQLVSDFYQQPLQRRGLE